MRCAVCETGEAVPYRRVDDVGYFRCAGCGSLFADPEFLANVEAGLEARTIKARLSPVVEVIVAIGTCLVLGYGARPPGT